MAIQCMLNGMCGSGALRNDEWSGIASASRRYGVALSRVPLPLLVVDSEGLNVDCHMQGTSARTMLAYVMTHEET